MTEILNISGKTISVKKVNGEDYISLTDMAKQKGDKSDMIIQNRMRSKNTIEFLGLWEQMNNKIFKPIDFEGFKNQAGSNVFVMTPKKWIEGTNAIGVISKSGRYDSGTFAHKDIAMEFASWISPEFKLYVIKEFQRLKEIEQKRLDPEWNVNRIISKINYRIHTDSVKENLIDGKIIDTKIKGIKYANEADMLNLAVFGTTNKDWRDESGIKFKNKNIRDYASIAELTVLSNCEYLNSKLIEQGISEQKRLEILRMDSIKQLQNIVNSNNIKKLSSIK